jgi:pimeloyl-ACP methyl ester carboxylesterase
MAALQTYVFQGKKLAYSVQGTGTPLVLLHGLCEDSTIWDEFVENLSGFKIIRPDIAGFGASEILAENSVELIAESVAALLKQLDIERSVMVGHSLGGYVAVAFAKLYPKRLLGLGMFHAHPFADTEEKKINRQKSIDFIRKNGHVLYVKQLIPGLFAELFATSNAFLMNHLIFKASKYSSEAIIGAHEAMLKRPDNSAVLVNLEVPVLFIIGKQDTTVPYDISLQQIHLPAVADIHILPKVAHMGMFRAKEETQRIIKNFVGLCTA